MKPCSSTPHSNYPTNWIHNFPTKWIHNYPTNWIHNYHINWIHNYLLTGCTVLCNLHIENSSTSRLPYLVCACPIFCDIQDYVATTLFAISSTRMAFPVESGL
ncbi:hypothetical protein AVEN_32376-1 [Araneus ventricosus]|uniref:Uncharacterized protein n=1 Tax=Araneus ventricosus TaxID=182803 RepID=A0A4Y2I118_ARAVE|nr:hypothetical protein AVEN_32376-1 [Araneus ventricosus]